MANRHHSLVAEWIESVSRANTSSVQYCDPAERLSRTRGQLWELIRRNRCRWETGPLPFIIVSESHQVEQVEGMREIPEISDQSGYSFRIASIKLTIFRIVPAFFPCSQTRKSVSRTVSLSLLPVGTLESFALLLPQKKGREVYKTTVTNNRVYATFFEAIMSRRHRYSVKKARRVARLSVENRQFRKKMLPLNLVLRRIHKHIEETKLLKTQHHYLFLAPGFSIILQTRHKFILVKNIAHYSVRNIFFKENLKKLY